MSATAHGNPYRTPTAALREGDAEQQRRRVLKLYLGLSLVLGAARALDASLPTFNFVGLGVVAFSCAGLFGYAFRRRVGRPWLWALWLPVHVAWTMTAELVLVPRDLVLVWGGPGRLTAFGHLYAQLFELPLYAALYLYAFRSPEIWRPRE